MFVALFFLVFGENIAEASDEELSIKHKIAIVKLATEKLKEEIDGSKKTPGAPESQFTDPNFVSLNECCDKLADLFTPRTDCLKIPSFDSIESTVFWINACVAADDKSSENIRRSSEKILQETSGMESVIPVVLECWQTLITLLRICYLAVTGENSLFNMVAKMNHVSIISDSEALEVLIKTLSGACMFCPDMMRNFANGFMSIVAKAPPENGQNVPSFFLVKFLLVAMQEIEKWMNRLEQTRIDFDRFYSAVIASIKNLEEDYALQTNSPNTPKSVRPHLEIRKKELFSLKKCIDGQFREVNNEIKSVLQLAEMIAKAINESRNVRMDTMVLSKLANKQK
jgi:hypothetical protein